MNLPILSRSLCCLILPGALLLASSLIPNAAQADELECGSDIVAIEKLNLPLNAADAEATIALGTHDSPAPPASIAAAVDALSTSADPTTDNASTDNASTDNASTDNASTDNASTDNVVAEPADTAADVSVDQRLEPFAMVGPYLEDSLTMVKKFQDWWEATIPNASSDSRPSDGAGLAIVDDTHIERELDAIASEEPIDAQPLDPPSVEQLAIGNIDDGNTDLDAENQHADVEQEPAGMGQADELAANEADDAGGLDAVTGLAQEEIEIPAERADLEGAGDDLINDVSSQLELSSEIVGRVAELVPVVIENLAKDGGQQAGDNEIVADDSELETVDVEVLHNSIESMVVEFFDEYAEIRPANSADETSAINEPASNDETSARETEADILDNVASQPSNSEITDDAESTTRSEAAVNEPKDGIPSQGELVDGVARQQQQPDNDDHNSSSKMTVEIFDSYAEIRPAKDRGRKAAITYRDPIALEILEQGVDQDIEPLSEPAQDLAAGSDAIETIDDGSVASIEVNSAETDEVESTETIDDRSVATIEVDPAKILEVDTAETVETIDDADELVESRDDATISDAVAERKPTIVEVYDEFAEIRPADSEPLDDVHGADNEPQHVADGDETATDEAASDAIAEQSSKKAAAVDELAKQRPNAVVKPGSADPQPLAKTATIDQSALQPAEAKDIESLEDVANHASESELAIEVVEPESIAVGELDEGLESDASTPDPAAEIAEPELQETAEAEESADEAVSADTVARQQPPASEPVEQLTPAEIKERKRFGPSVLIDTSVPESVDFRQSKNDAPAVNPLVGGSPMISRIHEVYMPYDMSVADLKLWSVFPKSTGPLCLRADFGEYDGAPIWSNFDIAARPHGELVSTEKDAPIDGSAECLMGELVWNVERWTGQDSPLWVKLTPHQLGHQLTELISPRRKIAAHAARLLASSWQKAKAENQASPVGQELLVRAGAIAAEVEPQSIAAGDAIQSVDSDAVEAHVAEASITKPTPSSSLR